MQTGVALAHALLWSKSLQITPALAQQVKRSFDAVNLPISPLSDMGAVRSAVVTLQEANLAVTITNHGDAVPGIGVGWPISHGPDYLAWMRVLGVMTSTLTIPVSVELANEVQPAPWGPTAYADLVRLYAVTYPAARDILKSANPATRVLLPLPEDMSAESAGKIGTKDYVSAAMLKGYDALSAHYYDTDALQMASYPFNAATLGETTIQRLRARLGVVVALAARANSPLYITEAGRYWGLGNRALWFQDFARQALDLGVSGVFAWDWQDGQPGTGFSIATDSAVMGVLAKPASAV